MYITNQTAKETHKHSHELSGTDPLHFPSQGFVDTDQLSFRFYHLWALSLPFPIDYLSYYVSLIHGQPELHKFTSSQRDTYRFHRVTQSFPLLEWHRDLAPSPVVIAGSTLFISQNLLCLLQFLKSLHWKTNQKMSTTLSEGLFKTPKQSPLLTSCVTLDQFSSSNLVSSFVKCTIRTSEIMSVKCLLTVYPLPLLSSGNVPGAVPGADDTGVNNRHDLFSGIAIYKHWENYNFVY